MDVFLDMCNYLAIKFTKWIIPQLCIFSVHTLPFPGEYICLYYNSPENTFWCRAFADHNINNCLDRIVLSMSRFF